MDGRTELDDLLAPPLDEISREVTAPVLHEELSELKQPTQGIPSSKKRKREKVDEESGVVSFDNNLGGHFHSLPTAEEVPEDYYHMASEPESNYSKIPQENSPYGKKSAGEKTGPSPAVRQTSAEILDSLSDGKSIRYRLRNICDLPRINDERLAAGPLPLEPARSYSGPLEQQPCVIDKNQSVYSPPREEELSGEGFYQQGAGAGAAGAGSGNTASDNRNSDGEPHNKRLKR